MRARVGREEAGESVQRHAIGISASEFQYVPRHHMDGFDGLELLSKLLCDADSDPSSFHTVMGPEGFNSSGGKPLREGICPYFNRVCFLNTDKIPLG